MKTFQLRIHLFPRIGHDFIYTITSLYLGTISYNICFSDEKTNGYHILTAKELGKYRIHITKTLD